MPLNIKNPEVEALVAEVASLAGETKTTAVRNALLERRDRLREAARVSSSGPDDFMRFLREEIWPSLPDTVRNRSLTQEEQDDILGYGPDGV